MRSLFKTFLKSSSGNIAIIAATALPSLILVVSLAVEYGLILTTNNKLRDAARSAALSAVNEAQIAYATGEDVDLDALVEQAASNAFASKAEGIGIANVSDLTITPEIINNQFSVKIDYVAGYNLQVMDFMSSQPINLSSSTEVKASATSYININMIFDVSGSMGIGATLDDQRIVFDRTGCAFACHTRASRGNSSYDRARAAGADMRIDVAREAAITAVTAVEGTIETDNQVTFGLHKFSNTPTTILDESDTNAGNFNTVRNLINTEVQMDIEGTGTNVELAIESVATSIPASGSGRTPDDRIQYIIVLTDGIENSQACTFTRCWYPHELRQVNSPSMQHAGHEINYAPGTGPCQTLRDQGAQIYFIHTEYITPSYGSLSSHNVRRFDFIEDTLNDIVPQRFAECAGNEDHVLRADSPDEIEDAFHDLISAFSSPLRFTN